MQESTECGCAAAESIKPPRARRLILCIDDETEIARILQIRLSRYGIDVASASNGQDGFAAAVKMSPDLVLLDLCMPGDNGEKVLARLRHDPQTSAIPVFLLTGANASTRRGRWSHYRPDAYLIKPLNFDELKECICAQFAEK